jgi:hypothetical protein
MGEAARQLPHNTPGNTPPQLLATVWKKGDPSPNPGGRPKGLSSYIREKTLEGHQLVDFLYNVMNGGEKVFCKMSDRLKAVEMLLGYGLWPKVGNGDAAPQDKPLLDVTQCNEQELQFLENVRLGLTAIYDRIRSGAAEAEPK